MIKININGVEAAANEFDSILQAARGAGIHIPTLCSYKDSFADGLCRVCVVEIKGRKRLMPACTTKVEDGMEILTDSEAVRESRKMTLDLICSNHRMECEYCSRCSNCELHALLRELGIDDRLYAAYHPKRKELSSPVFVRDDSKCVLCRRCESACAQQDIYAIGALGRASDTRIGAVVPMTDTGCIGCGQCLAACPTGALSIRSENKLVRIAMNQGRHVVFAIQEEDSAVAGKLVHILHGMGIDKVFDAFCFASVSVDEAAQQLERGEKGISPMCPAASEVCGKKALGRHPEEVFDDWCKTTYAAENDIEPGSIFTVYVSACTALKKAHKCDIIMSGAELGEFILRACVSRYTMNQVWKNAPLEMFDASLDRDVRGTEYSEKLRGACNRKVKTSKACGVREIRKREEEEFDFSDYFVCPDGCAGAGGKLNRFCGGA